MAERFVKDFEIRTVKERRRKPGHEWSEPVEKDILIVYFHWKLPRLYIDQQTIGM